MTVLSGLPSVLELDNVFSDLGSLDSVPGGTMERSSLSSFTVTLMRCSLFLTWTVGFCGGGNGGKLPPGCVP